MRKLIELIKWLMDAPTNITGSVPEGTVCEFCGRSNGLTNYSDEDFCICNSCIKEAYRKVLNKEEK